MAMMKVSLVAVCLIVSVSAHARLNRVMDTLQAKDGVTAPPAVLCPKGTFTKAKCGAFDQLLRLAVPEDKFIKTAHNLQYRRKKKPLSKKQTELFERVKQCQAPDWSEMDEAPFNNIWGYQHETNWLKATISKDGDDAFFVSGTLVNNRLGKKSPRTNDVKKGGGQYVYTRPIGHNFKGKYGSGSVGSAAPIAVYFTPAAAASNKMWAQNFDAGGGIPICPCKDQKDCDTLLLPDGGGVKPTFAVLDKCKISALKYAHPHCNAGMDRTALAKELSKSVKTPVAHSEEGFFLAIPAKLAVLIMHKRFVSDKAYDDHVKGVKKIPELTDEEIETQFGLSKAKTPYLRSIYREVILPTTAKKGPKIVDVLEKYKDLLCSCGSLAEEVETIMQSQS